MRLLTILIFSLLILGCTPVSKVFLSLREQELEHEAQFKELLVDMNFLQNFLTALPNQLLIRSANRSLYFRFFNESDEYFGSFYILDSHEGPFLLFATYRREVWNGRNQSHTVKFFQDHKGFLIEALPNESYKISFNGIERLISYNAPKTIDPKTLNLKDTEIFLSEVFDESGLSFALTYDRYLHTFRFLIPSGNLFPDRLKQLSERLFLDLRTEFIFFKEKHNNNLTLVGASKGSLIANNYYDGPFDQVPLTLFREEWFHEILREAFPSSVSNYNMYGYQENTRDQSIKFLALPFYFAYNSLDDMKSKEQRCEKIFPASLITCLTQQISPGNLTQ